MSGTKLKCYFYFAEVAPKSNAVSTDSLASIKCEVLTNENAESIALSDDVILIKKGTVTSYPNISGRISQVSRKSSTLDTIPESETAALEELAGFNLETGEKEQRKFSRFSEEGKSEIVDTDQNISAGSESSIVPDTKLELKEINQDDNIDPSVVDQKESSEILKNFEIPKRETDGELIYEYKLEAIAKDLTHEYMESSISIMAANDLLDTEKQEGKTHPQNVDQISLVSVQKEKELKESIVSNNSEREMVKLEASKFTQEPGKEKEQELRIEQQNIESNMVEVAVELQQSDEKMISKNLKDSVIEETRDQFAKDQEVLDALDCIDSSDLIEETTMDKANKDSQKLRFQLKETEIGLENEESKSREEISISEEKSEDSQSIEDKKMKEFDDGDIVIPVSTETLKGATTENEGRDSLENTPRTPRVSYSLPNYEIQVNTYSPNENQPEDTVNRYCNESDGYDETATEAESEKEAPLWSKRYSHITVYGNEQEVSSNEALGPTRSREYHVSNDILEELSKTFIEQTVRNAVKEVLGEEKVDVMKQKIVELNKREQELRAKELQLKEEEEINRLQAIEQKERELDEREKHLQEREEKQIIDEIERREKELENLEERIRNKEQDLENKNHERMLQEQAKLAEVERKRTEDEIRQKKLELQARQEEYGLRELELKKEKLKAIQRANEEEDELRKKELDTKENQLREKEDEILRCESELSIRLQEAELQKTALEEEGKRLKEEEKLKVRELELRAREMNLNAREMVLEEKIRAEEERILEEKLRHEEWKKKEQEAQDERLKLAEEVIKLKLLEEDKARKLEAEKRMKATEEAIQMKLAEEKKKLENEKLEFETMKAVEEKLKKEDAEKIKLEKEAVEKERIALEAQKVEEERMRLEEAERIRRAEEAKEKERIALEDQKEEEERIILEEAERLRLEEEAKEKERIALEDQKAEEERKKFKEAEIIRLKEEVKEKKRIRLEDKKAEEERMRLEEAERVKLEEGAEEKERIDLEHQNTEEQRIILKEAERSRLEGEIKEQEELSLEAQKVMDERTELKEKVMDKRTELKEKEKNEQQEEEVKEQGHFVPEAQIAKEERFILEDKERIKECEDETVEIKTVRNEDIYKIDQFEASIKPELEHEKEPDPLDGRAQDDKLKPVISDVETNEMIREENQFLSESLPSKIDDLEQIKGQVANDVSNLKGFHKVNEIGSVGNSDLEKASHGLVNYIINESELEIFEEFECAVRDQPCLEGIQRQDQDSITCMSGKDDSDQSKTKVSKKEEIENEEIEVVVHHKFEEFEVPTVGDFQEHQNGFNDEKTKENNTEDLDLLIVSSQLAEDVRVASEKDILDEYQDMLSQTDANEKLHEAGIDVLQSENEDHDEENIGKTPNDLALQKISNKLAEDVRVTSEKDILDEYQDMLSQIDELENANGIFKDEKDKITTRKLTQNLNQDPKNLEGDLVEFTSKELVMQATIDAENEIFKEFEEFKNFLNKQLLDNSSSATEKEEIDYDKLDDHVHTEIRENDIDPEKVAPQFNYPNGKAENIEAVTVQHALFNQKEPSYICPEAEQARQTFDTTFEEDIHSETDELILNNTLDDCRKPLSMERSESTDDVERRRSVTPLKSKEVSFIDEHVEPGSAQDEILNITSSRPLESFVTQDVPKSERIPDRKLKLMEIEEEYERKRQALEAARLLEEAKILKEREDLVLQQEALKNERLKLEVEAEKIRLVRLQEQQKQEEKRHQQELDNIKRKTKELEEAELRRQFEVKERKHEIEKAKTDFAVRVFGDLITKGVSKEVVEEIIDDVLGEIINEAARDLSIDAVKHALDEVNVESIKYEVEKSLKPRDYAETTDLDTVKATRRSVPQNTDTVFSESSDSAVNMKPKYIIPKILQNRETPLNNTVLQNMKTYKGTPRSEEIETQIEEPAAYDIVDLTPGRNISGKHFLFLFSLDMPSRFHLLVHVKFFSIG